MSVTDELYPRAVYFVTLDRKASTSYIQRKLQIGYNRAAALIEAMEREGIVGPANHVGKRDILVGPPNPTEEPAAVITLPPPAPPAPSGPVRRFECSRCDNTANAAGTLPEGWEFFTNSMGTMPICKTCGDKDRPKRENQALMEAMSKGEQPAGNDVITGAAQSRLRTIIERIERLEEERAVISNDIREVLAEAKGEGFDTKILKRVVKFRSMDKVKREEEDAVFDLYISAIGM